MRVFISGVAGFLGSHLAEHFLRKGHEVHGCDNLIGGSPDNVPAGVTWTVADCCNFEWMSNLLEGVQARVDVVYHCAALAYEGLSVFSPHLVTTSIVSGTTGILSAAIQHRVRRFVFCSSMARYGAGVPPFVETDLVKPRDPYGIAKYAAEKLVENLCAVHGTEYVICVPHNIIGPRQKYDDPYRNVASIFINRMLRGERPIVFGDGSHKRCFSFVGDVVDPLARMATDLRISGEVINVGPDDRFVTIAELGETIARLLGVPFDPLFVKSRPEEVPLANCSADKLRRLYQYEPRTSLEDGLQSMIEWIRFRGPKPAEYRLPLEIVSEKTPQPWVKRLI